MQFRAAPLVLVLALAACPVAPKDEKVEDDGADDATSDGEPRPTAAPKPGGDGDGDGDGDGAGGLSCEDELERAKSELAACLAK